MGDPDWGDDDDDAFLSTVDIEAEIARARKRQRQIAATPINTPNVPPINQPPTTSISAVRSLFYEQSRVDGNLIRDQHATEQPILGNPQFVYGSHNDAHLQPQGFPPPGSMTTLYASLELPRSRGASGGYGNHGQPGNRKDSSAHSTGGEPMLEVRMGWHDAVAVNLRRIGGGSWDVRSRCWIFPLSAHDRIMEALHSVAGVRVNVSPLNPIPIAVLKAANSVSDDSSRYCHIPSNLEEQLMPFQREGVRFGLTRGGRCLIGDEMGLGKTVQALALASAYRDEWPGLIISPSSLREQWADALHRWLGVVEDRIYVVHSGKDALNVPRDGGALDFVIISYNFLDKMDLVGRYNLIIVDESHYIKDASAKRTKAALPILKEARRCVLLTGTPALNRPKEIFTQLSALLPSAKIKMRDFGERYCAGNRFDKYGGAQNLDELHSVLRGSVMVRRLKADVLTQLPKKRRQQVFLMLDGPAKRELADLEKQLETIKSSVSQLVAKNIASGGAVAVSGCRMDENRAIMEMYRRTAELKTKAVQDYVEMMLDGGQKFLVFAHHTVLLDAIEQVCSKRKTCKYIRIDGKTPSSERSKLVNSFQNEENVKVAILSIRAAGVGLTLTAASIVVFAEMTWTPGEIIQAEDRAHRIGQASSVNVYFLHVKQSVDDIIWASVQSKLENVGQALDGEDKTMDVSGIRTMPERGQKQMESYFMHRPLETVSDNRGDDPRVIDLSH